jgi:hypothetical protein
VISQRSINMDILRRSGRDLTTLYKHGPPSEVGPYLTTFYKHGPPLQHIRIALHVNLSAGYTKAFSVVSQRF